MRSKAGSGKLREANHRATKTDKRNVRQPLRGGIRL